MGEAFSVGSRVNARGLICDVIEVAPLGPQLLLRLRCVAGDLAGLEWGILHPTEVVTVLHSDLRPDAPGPLDHWRLQHQAHLLDQVLGPADVLLADPGRLRIEPYQLVPLMRALEMPRPRLLIADGVGLGKTVEAGLIACELIARRRAHRVLVVSPPGPLLVQWAQEFRHRFALRFVSIASSAALLAQRRRLELGGNPFHSIALCLTSLDFAKQERVLEELERATWDLAIVDEAHHCVSGGSGSNQDDTQRRRLAEVIARRSDGLLLLTVTPHDGYDPHFASLIELLDPSLVDGQGGVAGNAYRRHVVRRLKSHLRDARTGLPLFRERRVIPVKVEVRGADLEPVRTFHRALASLIAPRLRKATRGRDGVDALAFVSLLKRSVSTISSCVATLRVVADRYRARVGSESDMDRRHRTRALRAYRRQLLHFGVLPNDDESNLAELEADSMAAHLQSFAATDLLRATRASATVEALEKLIAFGKAAEPYDPKLNSVWQEICTIRAAHPGANILVYTEYADSQAALAEALRGSVDGTVLSINGADSEAARTQVAERCAEEDGIVLVSTDSLAEGLNLQQRCCNLIHLDLPYNPNRLEQRNGRIDRYGQQGEPQIRYLYLAGTFEERLLLHLIRKFERARSHLTFMPDTLAVTADRPESGLGLIAGFAEQQESLFDDEPVALHTIDREAEATNADSYRDLLREIDRAFDGFDRSAVRHGWLGDLESGASTCSGTPKSHVSARAVDLPDFVAAAIKAEAGRCTDPDGVLRLPADWRIGLDGLPGFDRKVGTFRLTRDHTKLLDEQGRSLGVLGRTHPLVRRAISLAHTLSCETYDGRVSVARANPGAPLSVLFTFNAELRGIPRVELQRVIAVLLAEGGEVVEYEKPEQWLPNAKSARAAVPQDAWRRLFAHWVPQRHHEVWSVARAAMRRQADHAVGDLHRQTQRAASDLQDWLRRRAEIICGVGEPVTSDLFGTAPQGPEWKFATAPLERLAHYAADAGNSPERRREADGTIQSFQIRTNDLAAYASVAEPVLQPIGMLMLVPASRA
jgi:hypothetical protein